MPSPQSLLPWLIGGAIGAGGILQGLHWKSTARPADSAAVSEQLRSANEEIALLKRENASLRSLAQGGGEVAVPPELVSRVEKEFGLSFKSVPVVHQISGDDLRDRVTASYESRYGPAGADYRQEAYRYIGWMNSGDLLVEQLAALDSVGVKGWFDDESGESWVTGKFQMESIPDQAAMVGLLARMLLHQHFPPPAEYAGDEAERAREALQGGAAAGSEGRFFSANAREIGFVPLKENTEAGLLLASLPPFIQGLATFPLTTGKGLADRLLIAGKDQLQAALREPAETTQAIFREAEAKKAPPLLELPASGEEALLSERAGELGLWLLLEPAGDVGMAMELASAWRNDRYQLFPEGEASSGLVWDIVVADEKSADELQALFLNLIAARAGKADSAILGEPVEGGDKRFLTVSRPGPERLRFLNTAARETAERMK